MSKIPLQQRTTDFMKMDSLQTVTSDHGLVVMSFHQTDDGRWYVKYFDRAKWESLPAYFPLDLSLYAITSKSYPTFEEMVMGEIRRLKENL